jgi:hypothetical protein
MQTSLVKMVRTSVELALGPGQLQCLKEVRGRQAQVTLDIVRELAQDPETLVLMLMGETRRMRYVRCCPPRS